MQCSCIFKHKMKASHDLLFYILLHLSSISPPDHQAVGHCHSADARPPSAPHHAHHGLRAAALPAAAQPHEDRPGEELRHALLAGVAQTHDGGELPR